jgi:hypothetical protein
MLRRYDKVKPDAAKVKEYYGYIAKQWDRSFRPKQPGYEFVVYGDDADEDDEGGDCNG